MNGSVLYGTSIGFGLGIGDAFAKYIRYTVWVQRSFLRINCQFAVSDCHYVNHMKKK